MQVPHVVLGFLGGLVPWVLRQLSRTVSLRVITAARAHRHIHFWQLIKGFIGAKVVLDRALVIMTVLEEAFLLLEPDLIFGIFVSA